MICLRLRVPYNEIYTSGQADLIINDRFILKQNATKEIERGGGTSNCFILKQNTTKEIERGGVCFDRSTSKQLNL